MTTPLQPPTRIVVVTGPPASGKTTLALAVSERLGIPLIAKDGIKERLYEAFGSGDREWSRWLGRATYPLIFHFLEAHLRVGCSVVVEGTFGPESANGEFAQLHAQWPFHALQLFCWVSRRDPAQTLRGASARTAPRARRRLDDRGDADPACGGSLATAPPPRELLTVDTTSFETLDVEAIVSRASRHLMSSRAETSG